MDNHTFGVNLRLFTQSDDNQTRRAVALRATLLRCAALEVTAQEQTFDLFERFAPL